MAIHTFVYRTLLSLALIALVAGCTDPDPNPPPEASLFRDGNRLDMSANTIGPSPDGKPWIVDSTDWHISADRTVTIQAGTEIMFAGLWWVDVEGQIIAEGTVDAPITFTSAYTEPDLGQWRGFKLTNSDPARASVFRHCIFTYGAYFDDDTLTARGKDAQFYRGMLSLRNSSPTIERCLAYKNQNNAVFIIQDDSVSQLPNPEIHYNIFTKNDGAALRTAPGVLLDFVHFSYNCVGDNSIIPFLLYETDSTFGYVTTINSNLDSTDAYYNLDAVPEMTDPDLGDYSLTSCSPCVDAGPPNDGTEPDGTRYDFGVTSYHQVPGELRGVITGSLVSTTVYRMSCHVRVPQGQSLTIPAGTRIETTGNYNLEVFGRLEVGTPGDVSRVHICPCQAAAGARWGGLRFFNFDSISAPSIIRFADLEGYDQLDIARPGVVFDNVRFDGGYYYGAAVMTGHQSPSDATQFQTCTFTNCGSYALRIEASSATIRNTLVENIRGRGISMDAVGNSVEIYNTVVRTCSTSGIVMENVSSPLIVNNVITDCSYHGLHLINNCQPTVMNTIVYANHRDGIRSEFSSAPQLSYNNFADNNMQNFNPAATTCGDCISQNPTFSGGGDLHLGAGSPSIDAGNPDPTYNDTDGSRNDQGAYGGPGGSVVGTSALRGSNRTVVMR